MRASAGRAAAVAGPIILFIVFALFALSYLISMFAGLPVSLGLPPAASVFGGAIVVVGLALIGWVFRYRSPTAMVVSTYITFAKMFGRIPVAEKSGRTEALVVAGPQKYVRHPLYFGIIVMVFGWAFVGGYTFVLVAALAILLWFQFVMIPFEEKELLALFGDQYARYVDGVPMLFPFTKGKKRPNHR
jgi:protein-S-isoprenylcysteine O-methyltransferase Ste14